MAGPLARSASGVGAGLGAGRRRRAMGEINMVPFIDVMLVLLVIFMVTAPLITTGTVDLPSVGRSQARPARVVEVQVGQGEDIKLRTVDGGTSSPTSSTNLANLAAQVAKLQAGQAQTPVVISADRQVRYEAVVNVMDKLQRAGIQRVGLSVKQGAP